MPRKIAYWGATGLVGIVTLFAGFSYLTTAPEAVENFRHVGYPQQLRVLLGIGKLAGAIVLLLPRLPTLKEWAYAGFTFMWIAAAVAHYIWRPTGNPCCPSRCSGCWRFRTSRARRIVAVPRRRCWRSTRFRSRCPARRRPDRPDREKHRVSINVEGPAQAPHPCERDP